MRINVVANLNGLYMLLSIHCRLLSVYICLKTRFLLKVHILLHLYLHHLQYILHHLPGKNDFFLETFPNACFWKNVFGKMSFGEAVFPKSHYSYLEKLRENRDLHSVVTVHFGRFHFVVTVNVSDVFSGRNTEGGVH